MYSYLHYNTILFIILLVISFHSNVLYPYSYVNRSVCLVCCVFDGVCELLVKQFAICFGVGAIL